MTELLSNEEMQLMVYFAKLFWIYRRESVRSRQVVDLVACTLLRFGWSSGKVVTNFQLTSLVDLENYSPIVLSVIHVSLKLQKEESCSALRNRLQSSVQIR